jgi:hypothetical protein
MKKLFFFAAALFAAMTINATELFDGSHAITWDTPLNLEAAKFADAQPGQKIVVSFTDAADGIEFKVLDVWDHLAGSREAAWIGGEGNFEQFLTPAAVEQLKEHGLQIVGNHFTATHVELADGKELRAGITVWTGFFWADEWSTLELYKEGYAGVDFSKVEAVRFYSEAAEPNYVLNFLQGWGEGEKFADQGAMTDGDGYKELALTDDLRTRMAEAGHWMVQFNKEGIAPFNVTDIVLVQKDTEALVGTLSTDNKAVKRIVNGQVVIIRDGKMFNALGAQL